MSEKEPFDPEADVAGGDTSGGDASGLYGDAEAALASGMTVPSLRVLQAAGAIQAQKVAKPHGGFRRTWPEKDVLKASIAAAMGEHFAWNIRIVAEAIGATSGGTWDALLATAFVEQGAPASGAKILVRASDMDWHLELVDRKFLFLKVQAFMTAALPEAALGQTDQLLGMALKDGFMPIPGALGSPQGRARLKRALAPEDYPKIEQLYRVAMAAWGNFESKATINASMRVRKASHLLQGRSAHFVQELIQPRKRKTDP
jgi:hypothetical protein